MTTIKPNRDARFAPQAQLAAAEHDLESARKAHAYAAYQHSVGAGTEDEVIALETEMATHRLRITRAQAATEAAQHVITAQDQQQAQALEAERLARIAALGKDVEKSATQLIAAFDALAPILGRLDQQTKEAGSLAWAVVTERLGWEQAGKRYGSRIHIDTGAGVLLSAIATSGLGRIGPQLEPHVVIAGTGHGTPEDAVDSMRKRHAKLLDTLKEVTSITTAMTEGAEA